MSNDYFNHSLNEQARTIIYKINKVDELISNIEFELNLISNDIETPVTKIEMSTNFLEPSPAPNASLDEETRKLLEQINKVTYSHGEEYVIGFTFFPNSVQLAG